MAASVCQSGCGAFWVIDSREMSFRQRKVVSYEGIVSKFSFSCKLDLSKGEVNEEAGLLCWREPLTRRLGEQWKMLCPARSSSRRL